jgi:hypothetical protein
MSAPESGGETTPIALTAQQFNRDLLSKLPVIPMSR